MNLSIITGPPFIGGILQGLNNRQHKDFKPDPNAFYKILGITAGIGAVRGFADSIKPVTKPAVGTALVGGFVGGGLVAGSIYCIGLMLTKIPDKSEE